MDAQLVAGATGQIQEVLDQVEFGLYTMSEPEPQLATHPQARNDATGLAR